MIQKIVKNIRNEDSLEFYLSLAEECCALDVKANAKNFPVDIMIVFEKKSDQAFFNRMARGLNNTINKLK